MSKKSNSTENAFADDDIAPVGTALELSTVTKNVIDEVVGKGYLEKDSENSRAGGAEVNILRLKKKKKPKSNSVLLV